MKKAGVILLVFLLLVSLAACGKENAIASIPETSGEMTQESTEATKDTQATEQTDPTEGVDKMEYGSDGNFAGGSYHTGRVVVGFCGNFGECVDLDRYG